MKVMEIGRNYYMFSGVAGIDKPQEATEGSFAEILNEEMSVLSQQSGLAASRLANGKAAVAASNIAQGAVPTQGGEEAGVTLEISQGNQESQRSENYRPFAMSILISGMVHNVSTRSTEPAEAIIDENVKKRSRVTVAVDLKNSLDAY